MRIVAKDARYAKQRAVRNLLPASLLLSAILSLPATARAQAADRAAGSSVVTHLTVFAPSVTARVGGLAVNLGTVALDDSNADLTTPRAYGPPAELERAVDPQRYTSFGSRVGAVKWEVAGIFALLTAGNIGKVIDDPQSFRFEDEGLFGKNTADIGVDKFAHAYNTYLFSEILYRRMARKTGGGLQSAVTAAVLGSGLQIYGEIYDGLHAGSGFSFGDVGFNLAGAGFSVLRNTVPRLMEKVDFRISIVPNGDFYTYQGKRHFEQERFLFALKLSGFEALQHGPLRFLELHAGYYAKDFDLRDRASGITPKRRPFVGVGINFTELFFKHSHSTLGRGAATLLEYYQIPYTSVRLDKRVHVE